MEILSGSDFVTQGLLFRSSDKAQKNSQRQIISDIEYNGDLSLTAEKNNVRLEAGHLRRNWYFF